MTRRWTPAADWLVTEAQAVEILWHPNKRIHLKPFLGRSNDLASASAELGIKKTAMKQLSVGEMNLGFAGAAPYVASRYVSLAVLGANGKRTS